MLASQKPEKEDILIASMQSKQSTQRRPNNQPDRPPSNFNSENVI